MRIRFLADENFDHRTLTGIRRRDPLVDIVSVQQAGLRQADDLAVLEWAAHEGRILLTHDVSTMRDFAYQRVMAGLPMPGVLAIPATLSRARKSSTMIILIAAASESDDWSDAVHYLPLR